MVWFLGKVKLLLDVIEDLRSLADSLGAVADAMAQSDPPAREPEQVIPAPDTTSSEANALPQKKVTLETVRAVLAEKSRKGFTAQVRAMLQKYGAPKLSQIDPADYPALVAEAEVLGDG